jgi:hypothetical protein
MINRQFHLLNAQLFQYILHQRIIISVHYILLNNFLLFIKQNKIIEIFHI